MAPNSLFNAKLTLSRCCFRWDLRQGIFNYGWGLLVASALRAVVAGVVAWDQGNAFLLMFVGAALYVGLGWACLRATKDYRAVLGWSPQIREAAAIATGLGVTSVAVDGVSFLYLITWAGVNEKPDGIITYIVVQQIILLLIELYMACVLWSYFARLSEFQPVIPEQKNLPPPATNTPYPVSSFSPASLQPQIIFENEQKLYGRSPEDSTGLYSKGSTPKLVDGHQVVFLKETAGTGLHSGDMDDLELVEMAPDIHTGASIVQGESGEGSPSKVSSNLSGSPSAEVVPVVRESSKSESGSKSKEERSLRSEGRMDEEMGVDSVWNDVDLEDSNERQGPGNSLAPPETSEIYEHNATT